MGTTGQFGQPEGRYAIGSITFSAADGAISARITGAAHPDQIIGSDATFTGQFSFTDTLIASGPERSGFLQYSAGILPAKSYIGSTGGSIVLGGYAQIFGNGYFPGSGSGTIPVTLGTPFALTLTGNALMYAARDDGSSSGNLLLNLSYRFFEADRVTPVVLQEYGAAVATPEPGTWALFLGSLLCCSFTWLYGEGIRRTGVLK